MKRIAIAVVTGFLAGLLCQYAFFTSHVLAQSVIEPKGPTNQRFALEDQGHNSVGELSFDASGAPVIVLTGQPGKSLRGRIFHVLCEIRPYPLYSLPSSR